MVIDSAAQSVPNLRKSEGNHESAGKDGFKVTAFLSHYTNGEKCEAEDNVHADKLTHMIVKCIKYLESQERDLSINEDRAYEELLEDFIDEARKYLKKNKLNNGFKLGTFQDSKLYQEIKKNKVSFVNVDSPNSSLTVNDEPLGSAANYNHSPTLSSCL